MSEVPLDPIEPSRPLLERPDHLDAAWQALGQKLARLESKILGLIEHPDVNSGRVWQSADGRMIVIEDIQDNDSSMRFADQLLYVKSLVQQGHLPTSQLAAEVDSLRGRLNQAIATLHSAKDRPRAQERGKNGGLAKHVETRALKEWAEAQIQAGNVPARMQSASEIARWLLTPSPDGIRDKCPAHTLDDPERVVADHIRLLRKNSAA